MEKGFYSSYNSVNLEVESTRTTNIVITSYNYKGLIVIQNTSTITTLKTILVVNVIILPILILYMAL